MDLTIAAIPGFFATMGLEHAVLRRRTARGDDRALGYETRDTLASLSMGVGSLVVPLAMSRLLAPVTPGRGRHAKVLVGLTVGAAGLTTLADALAGVDDRRVAGVEGVAGNGDPADLADAGAPSGGRRWRRAARRVASSSGVVAVAGGIVAGSTAWAVQTGSRRLWARSGHRRDLGTGVLATLGAVLAWDFVYYWNHRLMHESRWLWAIHVVHHSSERYNLSTALRQPVAENFGSFVPYGLLSLAGFRPGLVELARQVNLLYQYWIHTEAVARLGGAEAVLNTPSHHRVHHGRNARYLDRNHGSILIVWDRLFGTFQREDEPVVYGLTRNIATFDPLRIATHEHAAMLGDVARSTCWRDRLSTVLRGPGWSYRRWSAYEERSAALPRSGAEPQLTAATS